VKTVLKVFGIKHAAIIHIITGPVPPIIMGKLEYRFKGFEVMSYSGEVAS
jgi:hypothetical protein